MARYPFPSTQPASYYYPPQTTHSAYSTPRRRHNSLSHNAGSTPYHAHNYLTVPATTSSHRSRSRSRSSHGQTYAPQHHSRTHSQSRHAHDPHGYNASMHTPSTAHSYLDASGHQSHRYPSAHSHQSHHSRPYSHASSSHHYPTRQRTLSISDRVRQFFGLDPPHRHHQPHPADAGRRRHNSFSSYRDDHKLRRSNTRTGPWFFGSSDHRRFVDEHGREVDHHGRIIHRF